MARLLLLGVLLLGMSGCKRGGPTHRGPFAQVVAASHHTCLLESGGAAKCFGGDTTTMPTMRPVPIEKLSSIATGERFVCGIRSSDAAIACWGDCSTGTCDPPAGEYVRLVLGRQGGGCGFKRDSRVVCWGNPNPEFRPPAEQLASEGLLDLAFGLGFAIAIRKDGSLAVWVDNEGLDLGATEMKKNAPSGSFRKVVANDTTACAVRADSTRTDCWARGAPSHGFVAFSGMRNVPTVDISADSKAGCLLMRTAGGPDRGSAYCGGDTGGRDLGNSRGEFVGVANGRSHACALTISGDVQCWGSDLFNAVSGRSTWPSASSEVVPKVILAGSRRMERLRTVLAGTPDEQAFSEVYGIVSGRKYPGLPPWRDEHEKEEATTEALRSLEKWPDALRSAPLNSREVIDNGVVAPSTRLLRRIQFYRDDNANSEANLLAKSPHMADLRQIVVTRSCCDLLKPFTGSTEVRALHVVEVNDSPIFDETWNRLTAAPAFAGLERLALSSIKIRAVDLGVVLDGTPGRALHDLELRKIANGSELLRDVLSPRKTILKQLTSLALHECFLRDPSAETLANAADLKGLTTLDLRKNQFSATGRKTILDAPQFHSTRVLFD